MSNFKDDIKAYGKNNKAALIFLAVCILVIFLSSFIASAIQSDGWQIEVTDLRNAENEGTITVNGAENEVEGRVVSGILFKPKGASADNPLPGRPAETPPP